MQCMQESATWLRLSLYGGNLVHAKKMNEWDLFQGLLRASLDLKYWSFPLDPIAAIAQAPGPWLLEI